jgi:hypothetical protein
MRQLPILVFLLCLPFATSAQTLNGKVYDATGPVKNIKISNDTQNRVTATNEDGNFNINAKVNDTILFESVFYHPKAIVLTKSHLEDIAVFELKKIVSELDEVEIIAESKPSVFEAKAYSIALQNSIQEDIKNNPHLYQPEKEFYGGVDFVAIIGLVVSLLKNKNKTKIPVYQPITYNQMDSLFNKSSFFTERLVTENLNINKDKVHLFYDFCEAKYISSELLKEEKKMQLLEQLVSNSQLFLILLEQYGEQRLKKD